MQKKNVVLRKVIFLNLWWKTAITFNRYELKQEVDHEEVVLKKEGHYVTKGNLRSVYLSTMSLSLVYGEI